MIKFLFRELSDTYRLLHAFKTGFACLIAELFIHQANLKYSYWVIISAFIVTQLSISNTLRKMLYRIIGTLLGCSVGFLIAYYLSFYKIESIILMFLFLSICMYIVAQNIYSYAWLLAGATICMVVLGAHSNPNLGKEVAQGRFLDIFFGVSIAFLVSIIIRINEKKYFKKNFQELLWTVEKYLKEKNENQAHFHIIIQKKIKRHNFFIQNSSSINENELALYYETEVNIKYENFKNKYSEFISESKIVQNVFIDVFDAQYVNKNSVSKFTWSNKFAYISSFKATLSAVIATVLWVFPFGNVQAVISSIIVSNQSSAHSSKKLYYRFFGTLIGGLFGFIYLLLFHNFGFIFMGFVSLLLFIFSFVGLSEDEWSYIGQMAGVAFILSVGSVQDSLHSYQPALHRIEGVVMGGLCALVISIFIFPKKQLERNNEN